MAEVEPDAHAAALGMLRLAPARLLGDELDDAAHAAGVMRVASFSRRDDARFAEEIEAELDRILSRRVRELVDERLDDERERVAARRAQRAGRHAARHHRAVERPVGDEAGGNSFPDKPAPLMKRSPSPNDTK